MADAPPPLQKKDNNSRALIIFIWVFLIFSIVTTVLNGIAGIKARLNPESPAEKVQRLYKDPASVTKHIRLGGKDYDVPVGYFNVIIPYETEDVEIYIGFMYPDFAPLTKSKSFLWKEKKQHYIFNDLVADPRLIKSVSETADFTLPNEHRTIITSHEYGLEVYNQEDERGSGRSIPYIYRSNGKVKTLITCSEEKVKGLTEVNKTPYCSHTFHDRNNLTHKVSYSKEYLPQWREIEKKISDMFDKFHLAAKEKKLDQVIVPAERIGIHFKERSHKH